MIRNGVKDSLHFFFDFLLLASFLSLSSACMRFQLTCKTG